MHRLVGCPLIRPCCPWWLALVCLPRFLPPLDLLTLLDPIEDLLPVLSGEELILFLALSLDILQSGPDYLAELVRPIQHVPVLQTL